MLRSAVLLLLVATAVFVCEVAAQTPGCGRSQIGPSRIVGHKVAKKGQYPWMVDILVRRSTDNYDHLCSGTLISDKFVLTAAHCFQDPKIDPSMFMIVIGEHDENVQEGTEVKIAPGRIHVFPGYDHSGRRHDIALLLLSRPIRISYPYINTACLPLATENFLNNSRCVTTGWSVNRGLQRYPILQIVNAPLVSSATCRAYFRNNTMANFPRIIDGMHVCFADGKGGCYGDSGGPLACPRSDGSYAVVGIFSFGAPSCFSNLSVYTNVTNYFGWIKGIMGL